METSILNVFVFIAFGFMVAVTGGVGYLTLAEWRDRRRQERDQLETRRSRPKKK